ncbi:hypothetical protein ABPG72_005406 [Tetrahymena utriculariae]
MDYISEKQFQCQKHPQDQLFFIQIDNIQNNQQKSLFYCVQSQEDDSDYKISNFILINTIIKKGTYQIIPKWPPVQDNSVLKGLRQQINQSQGES